jgi:RND family efflux transporter MFP subunit
VSARTALAVVLAATALAACRKAPPETVTTTEAVAVEVEAAHVGVIRAVITATGTVEPAPGADFTITAPGHAKIVEITKAEGDRVRAGELLVRFDAPLLDADAAARATELQQARANLENARKNHERLSLLLSKGIASRKEVEDARKDLLTAQAAIGGAQSAAANAADLAARATVRARFSGIVAKRSHNPGDTVEAVATDAVLRVIDPSRLQVSVAVPVADLTRVAVGKPARVLAPGVPDTATDGRVLSLPAQVDAVTGTATVRVSAPAALSAGTPVQVEIVAEESKDAVIVPAAALVREEDKASLFVVGSDNKAHKRVVTLGIQTVTEVEIVKGVVAGEKVITKGQEDLPDGAAVTVGS